MLQLAIVLKMKGSVRTSNKEEFSNYFSSKSNIYLHTDFENGDAIFRSSSDGGKGGIIYSEIKAQEDCYSNC